MILRSTWCCLLLYLTSSNLVQSVNPPLEYNIDYKSFWDLEANWSTTSKHYDESAEYPLVNYRDHAKTFDEFREIYPTVTIESYGKALSPDTFGDKGAGHFGPRKFETIHFNHSEYYTSYFVKAHGSAFWWDTGAEIGVRFKIVDTTLYLKCFINGWIYSGGAVWRKLQIGLRVTKITFNPITKTVNSIS